MSLKLIIKRKIIMQWAVIKYGEHIVGEGDTPISAMRSSIDNTNFTSIHDTDKNIVTFEEAIQGNYILTDDPGIIADHV